MITEKDLEEAILECKGQRNPNANTCIKLAAFLTIQRELYGTPEPSYSFAAEPAEKVMYDSGTEFSELIKGRDPEEVWPVIDELMTTLQVINNRLYNGVLRKLDE